MTSESTAEGRSMTETREAKRLKYKLGSVEVPDHMHGDNLAILLCSFYEDANGEQDENGWTEAATTGCLETLEAIHGHYAPTLCTLAAERDSLRAALKQAEQWLDSCTLADVMFDPHSAHHAMCKARDATRAALAGEAKP